MPNFEFMCLANSIKHGGRCIAGIKTNGSGWLRPVSNNEDGTLYFNDYTLDNGREPELFDIIRVECVEQRAKCHQPENWVISNHKWNYVGKPNLEQIQEILLPEIRRHQNSINLLNNPNERINYNTLKESPTEASLALIKPYNLEWEIKNRYGERKFRAIFLLGQNWYSLPITDNNWKLKLNSLEDGRYSCNEVISKLGLENYTDNKFFLTISLGEPFPHPGDNQQYCYKLVAAVINSSEVRNRLSLS